MTPTLDGKVKFPTSPILPIAPIPSSDYVTAGILTPNWHHFHWINIWSLTLRLETAKKSIRPIRYSLLLIVLTPSPTCDNALCNSVDSARSNFWGPRASAHSSLFNSPLNPKPHLLLMFLCRGVTKKHLPKFWKLRISLNAGLNSLLKWMWSFYGRWQNRDACSRLQNINKASSFFRRSIFFVRRQNYQTCNREMWREISTDNKNSWQ